VPERHYRAVRELQEATGSEERENRSQNAEGKEKSSFCTPCASALVMVSKSESAIAIDSVPCEFESACTAGNTKSYFVSFLFHCFVT
jgi:hypothetical protein